MNPRRLEPLTERLLKAAPGPRAAWVAAWAAVPWLNAGANVLLGTDASAVWEQRRALVILNYAVLSVAIVVTLWASGRIARRLETLADDATTTFRAMSSVAAPLLLSGVNAAFFAAAALARDGWGSALLRGVTWLVVGIALWTFLWTYASLQVGLDRLGRERARLEEAHADPTLGMRPLGDVAFLGLWTLLIWLVPLVLTGLPDVVGVSIGIAVLVASLVGFFASLYRLHRRMVAVKARELAIARDLYAQAYAPVRAEPTLETLDRQRSLLGAADALERRAHSLHDWPIDEGTFARVLTITTSVIAMTVARLILDPLGL